MKHIYHFAILTICVFFAKTLAAQQTDNAVGCGTMENIEFLKKQGLYPDLSAGRGGFLPASGRDLRCGQVSEIPVVVHVVHLGEAVGTGSNIPDAQVIAAVQGATDRWRNIIGAGADMEIEFKLARRTPDDQPTNGIVRVNGSSVPDYATFGVSFQGSPGADETAIKALSRWPSDDYYNIWVVHDINGGAAGWAYFPPYGQAFPEDGTLLLASTFNYNSGSLAHELGHAFNLYHTFEGDNGGTNCPPNANCQNDGDEVCDTPPHRRGDCGATNPCSGGGVWANAVSNYMSYCGGGDRFTAGQRVRTFDALDNSRRRFLLQSKGLIPVNSPIELTAANISFPGAVIATPTFNPIVNFQNLGTTNTAVIAYQIFVDDVLQGNYTVNVNIAPGQSANATLAAVTVSLGAHNLKVVVTSINGLGADVFQYDNSVCLKFTYATAVANFCHDFENNAMPSIFSTSQPGEIRLANLNTNCPGMQNRGMVVDGTNSAEQTFTFELGPISLVGLTKPWLSFDLARWRSYACDHYGEGTIEISANNGQTFTQIYRKNDEPYGTCSNGQTYNPTPDPLASVTNQQTNGTAVFSPSICHDWRREVLDLTAWAGQTVTLRFTYVFNTPMVAANNLFLDNFCLNNCAPADALSIAPFAEDTFEICTGINFPLQMSINTNQTNAGYLWQVSNGNPNGPFRHVGVTFDYDFLNLVPNYYFIRGIAIRYGCYDTALTVIHVNPDLDIVTNPQNVNACFGPDIVLKSIPIGGTPSNTYQWEQSLSPAGPFTPIAGENDTTLLTTGGIGTTYYRLVVTTPSPGCAAVASVPAAVLLEAPISISAQPADINECVGGSQALSITANSGAGGTVKYQWQRATDIAGPYSNIGTTTASYAPSSAAAGSWFYWCTVSSATNLCRDTSVIVQVNVMADPSITTQPVGFSGCAGNSISLSAGATGGVQPLNFQWQSQTSFVDPWVDISGANAATYTPTTANGTTYYRVVVSSPGSGCGTATSNFATVTLDEAVNIAAEPQSIEECIGGNQSISINATGGSGLIRYQWQSSPSPTGPFTNFSNTLASYTPPAFTAGTTYFRILMSSLNNHCKDTSVVVSATIAPNASITTNPQNFTGCLGAPISISAAATGGISPLSYQWQVSNNIGGPWSTVAGATSTSLTPPNTSGTQYYRMVVSSPGANCISSASNPANITLDGSVVISAEPQEVVQCVGGSQPLTVTGAGSGAIQYQWQTSSSPNGPFTNVGSSFDNYTPGTNAPGVTYYRVMLGSTNGACRDTSAVVASTIVADPQISAQPQDISGCLGGPLDLSVAVTGGVSPLIYEWETSPNGATWSPTGGNMANITPAATAGVRYYRVNISSNAAGCNGQTSATAIVTLDAPVDFATNPQDIVQCVGGSQTMSASATSTGPVSYQWQSATSATGPFANVGANNANFPVSTGAPGVTYYRVIGSSTNGFCKDTATVATSTVVADPAIATQPSNYQGCLGSPIALTVSATGGISPLNFQWQSAANVLGPWTDISGANTDNLTAPNTPGTTFYRAVVSSTGAGCGTATSSAANITLDGSVGLAAEPQNVTQCVGGTASLAANGTGSGTIVYQWQSGASQTGSFTNIGGNQNSVTPNTTAPGTTYFRVIVSSPNALCRDTSITVSSTVLADPVLASQPPSLTGCAGDVLTATISASGGVAPLAYQWQAGLTASGPWTDVPGMTGTTYTAPAAAVSGFYRVVVTSTGTGCDAIISNVASVSVDPKVDVSAQAQPITECIGGTQAFSPSTTGTGASFQWQQSASPTGPFTNVAGAQSANFTPPATAPGIVHYRLLVNSPNGFCRDTSQVVSATVAADPQISTQPQGLEACVGGSATLTSAFTGGIITSAQWQSATSATGPWTDINGAISTNYNPPLNQGGTTYYRMLVTSIGPGCDNAASNPAQILLHPKVDISAAPQSISECIGGQDPLNVSAIGGTALTYQWQVSTNGGQSWQNVPGATQANFVPPSLQNSVTLYRIVVADQNANCGADTSAAVTVTVKTDFKVLDNIEICNAPGGSLPTTVNFANFVQLGDPNAAWTSLDGPAPPGAWSAKDFTGYVAGTVLRFAAVTTNAVAPCINVRDTLTVTIKDCCPKICTDPPTQSLCNSGGTSLNLNTLECTGIAAGSWFLTAGPGVSGSAPVPNDVFNPANLTAGAYTLTYQLSGNFPPVCATTSGEQVNVIRAPEAGTATGLVEYCEKESQQIGLNTLLTGEDAGGQWSETSAVPSTPGAFNAATGFLQTGPLATGNFSFKYKVTGGLGCPDDETTVNVRINENPFAEAGEDKLLTCDDPTAVIGSPLNPTAGSTFEVRWREITGGTQPADSSAAELTLTIPGTYTITVQNLATGCVSKDTVLVETTATYISDVAADFTDPSCFGRRDGEITIVDITGGTAPFKYAINNSAPAANNRFRNLGGGDFTITIEDANGCSTQRTYTLVEPEEMTLSLPTDSTIFCGDSIVLQAILSVDTSRVVGVVWFTNTQVLPTPDPKTFDLEVKPVATTAYRVVAVDANGCEASATTKISVDDNLPVYAPNAMYSASSSLGNDIFRVFSNDHVKQVRVLRIFDRNGDLVFEQTNKMLTDRDYGWDGTYKGRPVNPGVFVYYAEIEYCDGRLKFVDGSVTVVR